MSLTAGIWAWLSGIDARILQAIIGGGVVALGWLVNGWRVRIEARRKRAERLRDVHKALFAEIKSYVEGLNRDDLDAYAASMVAKMRAEDTPGAPYVPFIPMERNETVYRSIVAEIHILPRATIDTVVLYYSQLEAISALVEDMRSDAFRQINVERRINMYLDYINMKKLALEIGETALEIIAAYAEGGRDAAEAIISERKRRFRAENAQKQAELEEKEVLNTPDEALSDR